MAELKDILAKNLFELRKARSLTQLELAEKLNYSDKSVSKWEHGDAVPDIEVISRIAQFYGVTVDYLIHEHDKDEPAPLKEQQNRNKLIITFLATSVVWIVVTIIYTQLMIWAKVNFWEIFVWAVPASCIVLIVFHSLWGRRRFSAWLTSVLVWSSIAAIYLQTLKYNVWVLFFIGAPLQIAIILWSNLKHAQ